MAISIPGTDFNDVYWHDGNLRGISVTHSQGKPMRGLMLDVELYESSQIPSRDRYLLNFSGVTSFAANIDFDELEDHSGPGNIANAYRKGASVYRVYLCHGFLEIAAPTVSLSAANSID